MTSGPSGGATIDRGLQPTPLHLDVPEIAAVLASLAALGPTATDSSASALRKLVAALLAC